MYFNDIHGTSKEEQIRAWSIEQSIEMLREAQLDSTTKAHIDTAARIEEFIKNGESEKAEGPKS